MSKQPVHIEELIWLADYYKRQNNPQYCKLIMDSVERAKQSKDVWAAVRYIERGVSKAAPIAKKSRKSA